MTAELRVRLIRLVVLTLIITAVLGIGAAIVLALLPIDQLRYAVPGAAFAGIVITLIIAVNRARAISRVYEQHVQETEQRAEVTVELASRHTQQWIEKLRAAIAQGAGELPRVVELIRAGQQPAPKWPTGEPAAGGSPFELLSHELRQAQAAVEFALMRVQQEPIAPTDPSVAVFANIARRVQSLAHRAIQRLDELEQLVEDPDLLKGLFAVDHLVTGVRRQAESLAVLGGSMPRRQWSRPVAMYAVLRSAVAEVEHYARVKVIPPVDGTLQGHAVADVIHLVAELVENATSFSEPDTQVTLNTQHVTAGLAIDIRDRGLGIKPDERGTLNNLLTHPDDIDRDEQLRDGRIGLYVVGQLAQRHHIAVELENNMYGGTDAHVVIPSGLLGEDEDDSPVTVNGTAQSNGETGTAMLESAPTRQDNGSQQPEPAGRPPAFPRPQPEPAADKGRFEFPATDHAAGERTQQRHYGRHSGTVNVPEPAETPRPSQRPVLPKRDRTRSYLVPQLANGTNGSSNTPEPPESRTGPNPTLWASFRQGVQGGIRDDGDIPDNESPGERS